MRILLPNPNTSAGVTEICAREARAAASPGTEIVPLTGTFGPAVISSRAEHAIATHMMVEMLADNAEGADAVVLAVSYDTALWAAREMLEIPVVGMTEAACLSACLLATRFALVTFGSVQSYRELVVSYGLESRLAGIQVARTDPHAAYRDPAAAERAIVEACREAVAATGAEAIVLAGAAMAGIPRRIEAELPVPVLDGIGCGVPLAEMLVRRAPRKARAGSLVPTGSRATSGIGAALAARLARPAP